MNAEATTTWVHGRHLTGHVRQLSIVVAGRRVPVTVPRSLSTAGFADDEHPGGADRAVFVYPSEHADVALGHASYGSAGDTAWAAAAPAILGPLVGEQLTSAGLLETEVFVGDTFRWGAAEVQVTAPAVPGEPGSDPTGDAELVERLRRSGCTGFHLRVLRSGRVGPADLLELIDVEPAGVSLATVGLAMLDGPAAAGVTPERLLLLRDVLPADLIDLWEALLPPADQQESSQRVSATG